MPALCRSVDCVGAPCSDVVKRDAYQSVCQLVLGAGRTLSSQCRVGLQSDVTPPSAVLQSSLVGRRQPICLLHGILHAFSLFSVRSLKRSSAAVDTQSR